MAKKIGLSLSFCVSRICRGEVPVEDVEKLIVGVICPDESAWNEVISNYKASYWEEFPEQAEEIVQRLRSEGKIVQPRLQDPYRYPILGNGVWVSSEKEIEYSK